MEGQLCTEDIGKSKAQFQLVSRVNTAWERSEIIGKDICSSESCNLEAGSALEWQDCVR